MILQNLQGVQQPIVLVFVNTADGLGQLAVRPARTAKLTHDQRKSRRDFLHLGTPLLGCVALPDVSVIGIDHPIAGSIVEFHPL